MSAIKPKKFVFRVLLGGAAMLLASSCDKHSAADPAEAQNVVQALDKASRPVDRKPIPGVDLSKLGAKKKERFYRLVDSSLQSPCGKPHSLRKSLESDTSCRRAPFAARYVISLLKDEADDGEVKEFYEAHYRAAERRTFNTKNALAVGPADAPVKLVEFYDYGCPACKAFYPALEEVVGDFPSDVVVYYKMFPLSAHPDSGPAAQAALAAHKQGKFAEMHRLLFQRAPRHKRSDLWSYAESLGLNMAKFETDFVAAKARVDADSAEGDSVKVTGTPTLFINGREYEGPLHPAYLKLWIEEELAVNR